MTLMALREAGERHHDLNGGDPDVSAKAAGHSKETKARYYRKVSYEEAQESYVKHHPSFVTGRRMHPKPSIERPGSTVFIFLNSIVSSLDFAYSYSRHPHYRIK
jgi:hypothetical protein